MNEIKNLNRVLVVGGGLAGVEAAWQLLTRGAEVELWEMRPLKMTPGHQTGNLAELLCSNSLRSMRLENASGLLKKELELYDSLIMQAARQARVPAGFALAVDRHKFSLIIEERLNSNPNFKLCRSELKNLDLAKLSSLYDAIVIATGPLTSKPLEESIQKLLGGDNLYFFDAQAPIIEADSIDYSRVFRASRYQTGEGDYLNCPFTETEYRDFYQALVEAKTAPLRSFESLKLFSGCQPLEEIARTGYESLRFGPMKPVGLNLPDGSEPYAVIQLRQDNISGSQYNLTGCQTRLLYPEQDRVFRLIPGLENASFARHGQMHRNSYINGPDSLDFAYRVKPKYSNCELLIVGQLSGVEGYLESAASGLLGAVMLADRLGLPGPKWPLKKPQTDLANPDQPRDPRTETMLGALANYLVASNSKDFQPAKSAFGLCRQISKSEVKDLRSRYGIRIKGRRGRRLMYAARALEHYLNESEVAKIVEAEL